MKKLLIFFWTFLFLVTYFSLYHIPSSDAQVVKKPANEACDCGGPGLPDCTAVTLLGCNDGLICHKVTELGVGKGVCVKPENQSIQCTCEGGGGQSGAGKNAFKCKDKTFHCKDSNHACYPAPKETVVTHDKLQEGDGYPGETLRGVYCREKQDKATCKCDNEGKTGDKQNTFKCTLDKDKSKTGTGGCGNAAAACKNDSGTVPVDTERYFSSLTGILGGNKGALITGIKCEIPSETEAAWKAAQKTQPLPPPPSPPCSKWGSNGECTAIKTALGEIGTNSKTFIQRVFAIPLSLSGGIALLLIIKSGYQLMVSQGKPETLQAAREQMTAAIVGLVFLIFSLVILQTIGVDILKIPEGQSPDKVTPGPIGEAVPGGNGEGQKAGSSCDVAGNNQCGGPGSGLKCVSAGGGRNGTCQKDPAAGAPANAPAGAPANAPAGSAAQNNPVAAVAKTVAAAAAPIVKTVGAAAAPVVKTVGAAAAPVVKTVAAAAAPVVKTVAAAAKPVVDAIQNIFGGP